MTKPTENIVVTIRDMERLLGLIDSTGDERSQAAVEALESELSRAQVVDPQDVPPDVVTMNSRVVYRDEERQVTREVTLCYPRDARMGEGRVSVLAPIGAALLGLRVGQGIDWELPGGGRTRLSVVAVPYQPESQGHWHL